MILADASAKTGLKVDTDRTTVMEINAASDHPVTHLSKVDSLAHLGSIINEKDGKVEDIKIRTGSKLFVAPDSCSRKLKFDLSVPTQSQFSSMGPKHGGLQKLPPTVLQIH